MLAIKAWSSYFICQWTLKAAKKDVDVCAQAVNKTDTPTGRDVVKRFDHCRLAVHLYVCALSCFGFFA